MRCVRVVDVFWDHCACFEFFDAYHLAPPLFPPPAAAQSDLTRIRDKVAALLNKRDAAARDLRKQLGELQQRAAELQTLLDEQRLKQAMESTATMDDAMARVGVPARTARGAAARSFVP